MTEEQVLRHYRMGNPVVFLDSTGERKTGEVAGWSYERDFKSRVMLVLTAQGEQHVPLQNVLVSR